MQVTKIKATKPADNKTKFPVSTREDGKFEFCNERVFTLKQLADAISKNFILNFPLTEDAICSRKSRDLSPLAANSSNYMILDFNDVRDLEARKEIIAGFSKFAHIAFKTKNTDDIFSFNFRLILKVPESTRNKILKITKEISKIIPKSKAVINTSAYHKAQVTAPGNRGVISYREDGLIFDVKTLKEMHCVSFTPEIADVCIGLFEELGFKVTSKNAESANLERNGERFIFFNSNPFEIAEIQSGSKVSVKNEFKKRFKISDFSTHKQIKSILDWCNKDRKVQDILVDIPSISEVSFASEISGVISSASSKNPKCIALKSFMGSGKSNAMACAIKRSSKTLIITPRISLAEEHAERFAELGAKSYLKTKPNPETQIFVSQFDSLFKLNVNEVNFDTIIIDEYMTLCDHMVDSVAMNKEHNISKLIALMNKASVVMVCDAFLERVALDLLPQKFGEIVWISNAARDQNQVLIHKNISSFLRSMLANRSYGIVVSCVSVSSGLSIQTFLESAGIAVGIINAETPTHARNEIIRKYKNSEISALVYSPCLSVGVNVLGLEGAHYHYDCGGVIPVIQSAQMVKRSRNSGVIECFVKSAPTMFAPSLEAEKFNLMQENCSGCVSFNESGDASITAVGLFVSKLRYLQKIWKIDCTKMFARLCSLNFESVSVFQTKTSDKISIKNFKEIKAVANEQKLEIFGTMASEIRETITNDEIDSFVAFERMFVVANALDGSEEIRREFAAAADFGFTRRLQAFQALMNAEESDNLGLLPSLWVEKSGFWTKKVHLNKKFLQLCEKIHKM